MTAILVLVAIISTSHNTTMLRSDKDFQRLIAEYKAKNVNRPEPIPKDDKFIPITFAAVQKKFHPVQANARLYSLVLDDYRAADEDGRREMRRYFLT